jgi:hypothetical protein
MGLNKKFYFTITFQVFALCFLPSSGLRGIFFLILLAAI